MFKIWSLFRYSGISVGRGSLMDHLAFWCPVPDVLFLTKWPDQGYGPPSTDGEQLLVSLLVLMQMWVTDGPCVLKIPGVSWTKITLAACSGGFLTMRTLDVVPLESIQKQRLCFVSVWYLFWLLWWQIICFTPQWNLIV